MRTTSTLITVLAGGLVAPAMARAAESYTCFDDLKLAFSYAVGDTFVTQGLTVNVLPFFETEGGAPVPGGGCSVEHFDPTCQAAPVQQLSINNSTIGIAFASPVSKFVFRFGDFSSLINLEVNGQLAIFRGFDNAPSRLGGATVEGVYVQAGTCGTLTVAGSITSIRIGGDSVWLDCIAMTTPATSGFQRADSNQSGEVDISDAIFALGFLFLGSPSRLGCTDAADSNDDGQVDLTDSVYLLNFLFQGGRAPPPPFGACGADPTADGLGCESFAGCVAA